jgi:hypothetical protein
MRVTPAIREQEEDCSEEIYGCRSTRNGRLDRALWVWLPVATED